MTRIGTGPTFIRGFYTLVIALVAVLATAATATAQEAVAIPVAPPVGAELSYDIPVQPWVVPAVLDLKVRFADGLSAAFGDIAGAKTGEDLTTLVEASRELSEAASRTGAAISAIGQLDVTYGIEGISRIIPAESALRDTLFGFVVWHEFSSTPARGMMKRFEGMAERVTGGGEASGNLSAELANARQQLDEAIAQGDADRIAELAPSIVETAERIDAVCGAVAAGAQDLGALVDSLSANSGDLLLDSWEEAARAAATCGEPAGKAGPALESVSGVLDLLVVLGGFLGHAAGSVDALTALPSPDGNLYVPWTVLRHDWELARDLTERVIEETHDEHEEGHEGHAHASVYVGGAASTADRARLAGLLELQVGANAILAERAVEHASTAVAGAEDGLERLHLDREGYSDDLNEKRKSSVQEQVDRRMRENMDLAAAKMSARAARDAFSIARSKDAAGAGHEVDALYYYHNAWLHSLNAGASAQRASGANWTR